MLGSALTICAKDLRTQVAGGVGLAQPILLGLVLVFVFSLSRPVGEFAPPQSGAAIFWLASAFAGVLIFNGLYAAEEGAGSRTGLLLAPMPAAAVWLGKLLCGAVLLAVTQVVFFPAVVIFVGLSVNLEMAWLALAMLAITNVGICVVGALIGALAGVGGARESLLTVLLFPLLVPVLLGGIGVLTALLVPAGSPPPVNVDTGPVLSWLALGAGFDLIFAAAGLVLFGFLYTAES